MNDLEKEFLSSLKALLTRYNVEIEKGHTGFDDEIENTHFFANNSKYRENEIYLDLNEYLEYLNAR